MIKAKNGYLFCFILAIVFHCVPIHGAIIIVPDNFKTIQEAIDEASWGDTVIVEDGVYKGVGNRNISFNGKILTLKSRNGQEYTTIDCEYLDRGFTFNQNEGYRAIIDGFTIQNGYASEGGGIYCRNSSPLIKNCTLTNCEANYGPGGGIYGENSSLSLYNCVIDSNKACSGGGLYLFNGFPYVKNCHVINNISTSGCQGVFGRGSGGGVYYHNNNNNLDNGIENLVIFENTIFSGNSSSFYGGGMYLSGPPVSDKSVYVLIKGCTFSSNETSQGGGLYGGNETALVSNTIFEKNNATGYGGGGIASSTSVFIDCKIRNNTSDGAGGGFYSSSAGSNPVLKGCEFNGNIAYGYYGGGGICLNNNASPKIIGCEFYNNSAMDGQGGGINLSYHAYHDEEKRGEIINCVFADNFAFEEGGAIIFDTWCGYVLSLRVIGMSVPE